MRLLVSVADAAEARAALGGGADIIDAKEPRHGALGAVAPEVLRTIRDAVGSRRPVSVALGDCGSARAVETAARRAAGLGMSFEDRVHGRRVPAVCAPARRRGAPGCGG